MLRSKFESKSNMKLISSSKTQLIKKSDIYFKRIFKYKLILNKLLFFTQIFTGKEDE